MKNKILYEVNMLMVNSSDIWKAPRVFLFDKKLSKKQTLDFLCKEFDDVFDGEGIECIQDMLKHSWWSKERIILS